MSWTGAISGNQTNTLTINNFNLDYNAQPIQVNSGCISSSRVISFASLVATNNNGGQHHNASLFPNPVRAGGTINLEISLDDGTNAPYIATISTIIGTPMLQQSSEEVPHSLSIGDWASGEYVLVVQKGSELLSIMFVIE